MFVPLDIFKKILHTKGIQSKLDAWLAFLCCDDPDTIIQIITTYPEFKPLYEHVYDICLNVEKVMGMFSKELAELDKNTVDYMIDDMQRQINELTEQNALFIAQEEKSAELIVKLTIQNDDLTAQNKKLMIQLEELTTQNQKLMIQLEEHTAQNQKLMTQLGELVQKLDKKD